MTKKLKNILLITFSAFLALSAALMLALTSSRANTVSADETYSETWVINENWTWTKDIDVNIDFKINGSLYNRFIVRKNENQNRIEVSNDLGNGVTKPLGVCNRGSDYIYACYNGEEFSGVSYSEWKDTFGKIIFCADTSAAEYEELRAWLNENASCEQDATPDTPVTPDNPTEPGGEENPSEEPTGGDVTDEEPTLGDKINEVTDNIASWLKDNTGLAFSSGGVILLAVVLALILFKRR